MYCIILKCSKLAAVNHLYLFFNSALWTSLVNHCSNFKAKGKSAQTVISITGDSFVTHQVTFKQLSDPHKREVTSKSWPKYPQYACDFYTSVDKQPPSSLHVSKTFLLTPQKICLILKLLLQSSFKKYAVQSMLLKLVLRHLPTL